MSSRWTWRLLALPGVAWLSVFFLVSFYAVLCVALGNQDTLSQPVPFWNPLDWNVGYLARRPAQYLARRPVPDGLPADVRRSSRSRWPLAADRLPGRLLRRPPRRPVAGLVLLGLILPFWINYLMRMLAWINLLSPDGWGTRFLHDSASSALFLALGLLSSRGGWLDGQSARS